MFVAVASLLSTTAADWLNGLAGNFDQRTHMKRLAMFVCLSVVSAAAILFFIVPTSFAKGQDIAKADPQKRHSNKRTLPSLS